MKKAGWNWWFYVPFFLSLITGGLLLIKVPKGEDVVFVNRLHTPFFDGLFYYGTTLGNGLLYAAVAVALLLKDLRKALMTFVCFSATGLAVQLLKKVVFSEMMRPSVVLAGEPLHFVEGVKLLKHYSFPSGHTAMAFSLFCLLSNFMRPKWTGLIFIGMALIGGISRIYLVQHFFEDVYFGAMLGTALTSLLWFWFSEKTVMHRWEGKSLFSILRNT